MHPAFFPASLTLSYIERKHPKGSMRSHEKVKAGARLYTVTDLRADITSLIYKFMPRNRVGFKTIEARNLTKGSISNSRHIEPITDAFRRKILGEHVISGTSEVGYHVREDAMESLQFFAANNSFTGPLRELYDELAAKFSLR
jgi:hypothetical protein